MINHIRTRNLPGKMLLSIFGLAVLVRIGLFLNFPVFVTEDSPDYLRAAYDLFHNLDFSSIGLRDVRAPGYPLLLAATYPLTGMQSDRIVLLQSLIGLISLLLAMQLGRQLKSLPAAVALALFLAFHPFLLLMEHAVMTEVLFLPFLLSFGILSVLCLSGQVNWLTGLLLGLNLAVCILIRPNALPFCAILGAGGLYTVYLRDSRQTASPEKSIARAATIGVLRRAAYSHRFWQFCAAAMLGAGLLVLPWMWRNYQLYDRFSIRNWNARHLFLMKVLNGTIDRQLPLLQKVNRQIGSDTPGYEWLWKLAEKYPTLEVEQINQALYSEQIAAHPIWQVRDILQSLVCFSGICIFHASNERLAPKYWMHTVVRDPALTETLNRQAGLTLANPDYIYSSSRYHNWLILESWSWAGTLALAGLRPLLYFCFFGILGLYTVFQVKGGTQKIKDKPFLQLQMAAIYIFGAGYLAMVAVHTAALSDSDRFALPFDLFALAAVILALQHLWASRK